MENKKMSYLDLINNFWRIDKNWFFNPIETRLYFYLLDVANSLAWQENPFWHTNSMLAIGARCSTNAMKTSRAKLQEAGLISFEVGGKFPRDKTRYQIIIPNRTSNITPYKSPLNRKDEEKTRKEKNNKKEILVREKAFREEVFAMEESQSDKEAFFNYWSEKTPDGQMMKYELEKTWETGKRFLTWKNNNKYGGMHLNGVKKVSVSNYFQIVFNKKRIILYQSSVNLRKTVLIKAFYVRYKATSLK